PRHAHGGDERVVRRGLESLVRDQDGLELEPERRAEDDVLHVPRRGVGIDPDRRWCLIHLCSPSWALGAWVRGCVGAGQRFSNMRTTSTSTWGSVAAWRSTA